MNHLGDTNKMVETPRTETYVLNSLPQVVSAEFTRQLERELNAANAKIKRLGEAGDELLRDNDDMANINRWLRAKEAKP